MSDRPMTVIRVQEQSGLTSIIFLLMAAVIVYLSVLVVELRIRVIELEQRSERIVEQLGTMTANQERIVEIQKATLARSVQP